MSKPDKNSEENEKRIAGFENRGRINGELFAENSNLFHKKVTYFAIADILIDFLGIIIAGEILNLGLLLGLIISIVGFILGISIIFEFNLPFLILSPCLVVNGFLIVRHQLIKHAMHVGK